MYLAMLFLLMQRPVTRSEHPIKSAALIEVPNLTVWRQEVNGRCFEVSLDDQKTLDQTISCESPEKKKK
jgi:hypothetical protein